MKQLTINGKTLGLLDVPKDAKDLLIEDGILSYRVWLLGGISCSWYSHRLPPGQWSILGRLNDISEWDYAPILMGSAYYDLAEALDDNDIDITRNPLIILNEKV